MQNTESPMTERKILTLWSDEHWNEAESKRLREPCEEIPIPLDRAAREDIRALVDAFLERDDALGLAAPQIGIGRRVIIFKNKHFDEKGRPAGDKDYDVLVNPRITQTRGEPVRGAEGCLSCPEIQVEIERHPEIKVRACDREGRKISKRYTDFGARIVQHEMDHLEGILIVDHEGTVLVPRKKRAFFESLLSKK